MPRLSASNRKAAGPVHLLDGNVLYALIDEAHVRHAQARQWFSGCRAGSPPAPSGTQGTLLRLVMRLGGPAVEQALALLAVVTAHARYHFWPDLLPYDKVRWHGVMGHRQATDTYLAGLARHRGGKLASFDRRLVALHPDVGVRLEL
jgi:predicted nucleic acid-binding protein